MTGSILLIADDLTGANAAASGFARLGLRTATIVVGDLIADLENLFSRFEVVVASTDSRHLSRADAAARVRNIACSRAGLGMIGNRIDTTLRGNIAASTEAILQSVRERSSGRAVAIVVAAHPAAGRQTVEGMQLLDGVRLEDTELAIDPLNPVHSSNVASIVTDGTSLSAQVISLEWVTGPLDAFVSRLRGAATDADVIVVDALTEGHLLRIADGAAMLCDEFTWVPVDPGPFSVALARALDIVDGPEVERNPILVVSGSASSRTRAQLSRLVAERSTRIIVARMNRNSTGLELRAVEGEVAKAFDEATLGEVIVLATALVNDDLLELSHQAAQSVSTDLATLARGVIRDHHVGGVLVIGGDVTVALLKALEVDAIEIDGEVEPLVVKGILHGGRSGGMRIVTKGGMVGTTTAVLASVAQLEQSQGHTESIVRTETRVPTPLVGNRETRDTMSAAPEVNNV